MPRGFGHSVLLRIVTIPFIESQLKVLIVPQYDGLSCLRSTAELKKRPQT